MPEQEQNQDQQKRIPARFRSLPVSKELELLWQEIYQINDTLSKLMELAEREHVLTYDEATGELIIPRYNSHPKQVSTITPTLNL